MDLMKNYLTLICIYALMNVTLSVEKAIVGTVYKSIDSADYEESYFEDLPKVSFQHDIIEKTQEETPIKTGSIIHANLGSIVFDADDLEIKRRENHDEDSKGVSLVNGKDLWLDVEISKYARPEERYNTHDTDYLASKNKTSSSFERKDSFVNCTFLGEGLKFDLEETDETYKGYDIQMFKYISFALINKQLMIKDIIGRDFMPINDYIDKIDTKSLMSENVSNLDFEDIMLDKQYFLDFAYLIGRTSDNVIYIWKVESAKSQMEYHISLILKFTSDDPDFTKKITTIGFLESPINAEMIIGVKGVGFAFYQIKKQRILQEDNQITVVDSSNSTNNTETTINDNTNQNNNTQTDQNTTSIDDSNTNLLNDLFKKTTIISSFPGYTYELKSNYLDSSFIDFKINKITIYVLIDGLGLKILDLFKKEYIDTIKHPKMKALDHIEMPFNQIDAFIGVSLENDPENGHDAFFVELLTRNERKPEINKIFTSKKKVRYDNFVTNLNNFSILFDKENSRTIILYRGITNMLDVPSYVIPNNVPKNINETALTYIVHVPDPINKNQFIPEYITSYNGNFIHIKNLLPTPFNYKCQFNKSGYYDIIFKAFSKCPTDDLAKGLQEHCLFVFTKYYDVMDDYKPTQKTDISGSPSGSQGRNDEKDMNGPALPVLIVVILLFAGFIIGAILYKCGCCKKKTNPTPTEQKYQTPDNEVNTSKGGEIEINVKHQVLEDDKI